MPGSAAERAGLQKNDVILQVNDTMLQGCSHTEAVARLTVRDRALVPFCFSFFQNLQTAVTSELTVHPSSVPLLLLSKPHARNTRLVVKIVRRGGRRSTALSTGSSSSSIVMAGTASQAPRVETVTEEAATDQSPETQSAAEATGRQQQQESETGRTAAPATSSSADAAQEKKKPVNDEDEDAFLGFGSLDNSNGTGLPLTAAQPSHSSPDVTAQQNKEKAPIQQPASALSTAEAAVASSSSSSTGPAQQAADSPAPGKPAGLMRRKSDLPDDADAVQPSPIRSFRDLAGESEVDEQLLSPSEKQRRQEESAFEQAWSQQEVSLAPYPLFLAGPTGLQRSCTNSLLHNITNSQPSLSLFFLSFLRSSCLFDSWPFRSRKNARKS